MKRVLVTGATGFLGRHCLPRLQARGYEVHALSSREPPRPAAEVEWHRADLLAPGASAALFAKVQPSHLLHLAWYAEPGKYWTSPENLRWLEASLVAMKEFARHGGRRIVAAGSCAEYDWRYGYCSEGETPLRPATLYGATKHALQTVLAAFAPEAGLSAAWGRIFFLFGPHEHPERLVAYVIRSLLRGDPARCTSGDQVRDFLYVEDAAEAFVMLLESEVTGAVNIGSGCPLAVRDLAQAIGTACDRPHLIRLGTRPERPDDPPLLVAAVDRLRTEVGFHPSHELEPSLRETIAWWQASAADGRGQ